MPLLLRSNIHIFNIYIDRGLFPGVFKITTVVPLHKKDNRRLAQDYRSILLLPSLSKILESIMKNRLTFSPELT